MKKTYELSNPTVYYSSLIIKDVHGMAFIAFNYWSLVTGHMTQEPLSFNFIGSQTTDNRVEFVERLIEYSNFLREIK